jgi:hypothetical protein
MKISPGQAMLRRRFRSKFEDRKLNRPKIQMRSREKTRPGPGVDKRKFTPEEDAKLLKVVGRCGSLDWLKVAEQMGFRDSRQCRERWTNYLSPDLKNGPWTFQEDAVLDVKFTQYGPRWSTITESFPGRSRNNVKNHWMARHRKTAQSNRPADLSTRAPGPDPVAVDQASQELAATLLRFQDKDDPNWARGLSDLFP